MDELNEFDDKKLEKIYQERREVIKSKQAIEAEFRLRTEQLDLQMRHIFLDGVEEGWNMKRKGSK